MKLFTPDAYYPSIHSIDLVELYEMGIRLILTDLDNTLVSYDVAIPTEEIVAFKQKANGIGFKLIVISNNKKKRVGQFADALEVDYTHSAKKPFKRHFKKYLKDYKREEIAIIGDQLLTDILGGNRMGFYTILVDVIDYKKEQFFTKFNRKIERFIKKRINLKEGKHGSN